LLLLLSLLYCNAQLNITLQGATWRGFVAGPQTKTVGPSSFCCNTNTDLNPFLDTAAGFTGGYSLNSTVFSTVTTTQTNSMTITVTLVNQDTIHACDLNATARIGSVSNHYWTGIVRDVNLTDCYFGNVTIPFFDSNGATFTAPCAFRFGTDGSFTVDYQSCGFNFYLGQPAVCPVNTAPTGCVQWQYSAGMYTVTDAWFSAEPNLQKDASGSGAGAASSSASTGVGGGAGSSSASTGAGGGAESSSASTGGGGGTASSSGGTANDGTNSADGTAANLARVLAVAALALAAVAQ